jgi:hypothetical protein
MALITKLDLNEFKDQFYAYGRGNKFSTSGLRVLFEYLDNMSEDIGQDIEIDVISLCCDYSEGKISSVLLDMGCETLEELEENTTVLRIDADNIVWQLY